MTPEEFIAIWKDNKLTERGGAQAHFDDLCDLLGVDKPRDPDNYCFERGAKKSAGGDGWADVWKRGSFGWENKKPGRDLDAALKQLTDYALQLENPPLLVVSDRERIIIHTAFTGYPDQPREIRIKELTDPSIRQLLKWVFTDPEKLRPEKSTAAITAEAAGQFANLAKGMRQRGLDGQRVAHFLVQCLFCMFAEDENLLPSNIFTDILKNAGSDADKAANRIAKLFAAMQQKTGGEYGDHDIPWFNGGLFKTIDVPALIANDLAALYSAAADMDWRAIDPTIFGTLFERGLDPSARAPLGAHYTDTGTIAKLIHPLITEPLLAEWKTVKTVIVAGQDKGPRSKEYKDAQAAYHGFMLRLSRFQVLDPACGSGNFLYLALKALRDVEKLVQIEARELGLDPELLTYTGPHNIRGIEINEYAAELARVTVWIGDIQWCRRNGREIARNPILRPLDSIQHRDALLNPDGSEANWPKADVIVGNPPFLGGSKMLGELGDVYVDKLRKCYEGRVPGGADLVTYWFEKAREATTPPAPSLESKGGGDSSSPPFLGGAGGGKVRAGFVATNSIRGGSNREVLKRICASSPIFNAWSDEPWINEGAAVRVSLVCFAGGDVGEGKVPLLNNIPVTEIYADLTGHAVEADQLDFTKAKLLIQNKSIAFEGTKKYGSFDISGDLARRWLLLPSNPNGRPNRDVLRPWANGMDITRRPSDTWIIDFGSDMPEIDAALYEAPYQYVLELVKQTRKDKKWWLHERPRPEMRRTLLPLSRYIATPRVAKHRLFAWLDASILPDSRLYVIASESDTIFGILHSRIHELWSLRTCSWHGVGNDPTYNAASCFETFPFPEGLTPNIPKVSYTDNPHAQAIASASSRLVDLRNKWLNPPEWIDRVPEVVTGYPYRIIPKTGCEKELSKRTLTNLYNARPAWLEMAHKELDKAVATAYGWDDYTSEMADDVILGRLLGLNQERAGD